jgi:membrane fusion protein (multidrug efflux system)
MKLKVTLAVLLVLVICGVLAGVKIEQIKTMKAIGAATVTPPDPVTTAVAHPEQWQEELPAIGSIGAVQGVTVTTEIGGTVKEIAFESGSVVAAGDLLVRLDTSSEEAQLRALESQVELAAINLERSRKLRTDNTIAQSELDTAEFALKQNQANADNVRAIIAKKTIRAPFAGRLGIRQVNLGQYLDSGKPVVSLQSLTPVYANFSLPQQELARLKTGLPVRVTTDAYPGRNFTGSLTTINPDLDESTRSVTLQATLDNTDLALRPGMFARMAVQLPVADDVLVIPLTAVLSAPYGDTVYVVEPGTNAAAGLVARLQIIRTGPARGDYVSVEAGLKAGQKVVSTGVFKIHSGDAVKEDNALTPPTSQNPQPNNS